MMTWLDFVTGDVQVAINAECIRSIESIGDKLTISFLDGWPDKVYKLVSCVSWKYEPRFEHPEVSLEDFEGCMDR